MKKKTTVVVILLLVWNLVLSYFVFIQKSENSDTDFSLIDNSEEPLVVQTTVTGYTTDITDTVNKCISSLVTVKNSTQSVSGIIYSSSSKETIIVTDSSIVEQGETYTVTFDNDEILEASLLGYDSIVNVAVYSTHPVFSCSSLERGIASALQAGEYVIALGSKRSETQGSVVSFGVSSSYSQLLFKESETNEKWIATILKTDLLYQDELAGGALINLSGQFMGLIRKDSANTIIAITQEEISSIVSQIEESGSLRRGYLGVITKNVEDLQLYQKSAMNLSIDGNSGVVITAIDEQGPCQEAQIQINDVILAIDDQEVDSTLDLQKALYNYTSGEVVTLTCLRGGETMEMEVILQ